VLRKAVAGRGPVIVEIDMQSIGGFAKQFAGPPVRKLEVVRD
jgi:acetolactate synthase I/II/III large subunit